LADRPEKLLKQASDAYHSGDKRGAARLVDQILRQDFNNPDVWRLLYEQYNKGEPLDQFQVQFARKYYPDLAAQLNPPAAHPPAIRRAGIGGFFSRLFGRKTTRPQTAAPTQSRPPERQPERQPEGAPERPSAPVFTTGRPAETGFSSERPTGPRFPSPNLNGGSNGAAPGKNGSSAASAKPGDRPGQPASKPISPFVGVEGGSGQKITLLVVDDIPETRENIIRLLRFQPNFDVIATASTGAEAIKAAREHNPDVILMDVNMPDMDGISATSIISQQIPTTQILILTVQDDVDYMRKAMRAGARDFLTKPPMIDELIQAVQRAGMAAQLEKAKAEAAAPSATPTLRASHGKIITIYSTKGGVGCTTLAANLALTLRNEETRVVIVDGNLQWGDVAVLYNEQGRNTILDLASQANELDPELVEEVMIKTTSGVHILAAPRPEHAEAISGEQFAAVVKYLSQMYAYVVIDSAHLLDNITFAAFDASDLIISLLSQDIPAIAGARKFIDIAGVLNLDRSRILMVMNQYDKRINIDPAKVSANLQFEVSAAIPYEPTIVIPSVNRGVPFMAQKENLGKPVGRAIIDLAGAARSRIARNDTSAEIASVNSNGRKPAQAIKSR
jgi:pilus assembly protein CpaE